MRFYEITDDKFINERIDTTTLYQRAKVALRDVLAAEYTRPKDRLKAIATALEYAASPYMSRWKSGVKNARGYELDKMHLQIICRIANRSGASFQARSTEDGILIGTLILHIEPYEELDEPTLSEHFAQGLANLLADAFEHEMVHYTQFVSINSPDPAVRSKARQANAYPVTDAQADAMTDEIRGRYLSSRNEITAYATNAARELQRAFGDHAVDVLSNLSAEPVMAVSSAIRRYVRLVKPNYPDAWRSFQRQIAAKLKMRDHAPMTEAHKFITGTPVGGKTLADQLVAIGRPSVFYHATPAARAAAIDVDGLRPRAESRRQALYGKYPDRIYLTTSTAMTRELQRDHAKHGRLTDYVVFAIDPNKLLPKTRLFRDPEDKSSFYIEVAVPPTALTQINVEKADDNSRYYAAVIAALQAMGFEATAGDDFSVSNDAILVYVAGEVKSDALHRLNTAVRAHHDPAFGEIVIQQETDEYTELVGYLNETTT